MQRQFTIELDETVCLWLSHISLTTGQTMEDLIVCGINNQISDLDDAVLKAFIETQN